jgi:hypothetical protein
VVGAILYVTSMSMLHNAILIIHGQYISFRCRNLDRNYFKRWLLRETPQDKMDIKLLQTFKKINMQSAMKVHDASKGLVAVPSSSAMQTSPSGHHLRSETTFGNLSQLIAAK